MDCSCDAVMFAPDTADAATWNQQLLDELYTSIIRKFQKHNIYSSFYELQWGCWSCKEEANITIH